MANTNIKPSTLLSFITFILFIQHHCAAFSIDINDDDNDGDDYYIVDTDSSLGNNNNINVARPQRLLLLQKPKKIKKGAKCALQNNICNGVPVNKGTGILHCCKKHCRNVLGDRNNCGSCGHKCGYGERCCNGVCTNVYFNDSNCGKCGKKCSSGDKCEYGYCGYA
ncbi:hypothetical protein Scep_011337 [Stephania cephalantha]|uniref:Protein GRIM REAPER n=1 Tax=Stephania cephalantha TaxID=152367 RepID=A0AAP0JD55_9MAGN